MQDKTEGNLPIYVSYSTFTTFLDWLAEMPVTPSQLDRSLWSGKFAGGVGSQLMGGVRFLQLLEGEKPTERLEALVRADAPRRKELMLDLLRNAYGSATIDSLNSMTPKLLLERLEQLGATEPTQRKAFSFLINAARANDIPIALSIAKKARNKPAGRKTSTGVRKPKPEQVNNGYQENKPPISPALRVGANAKVIALTSGGEVTVSISVDLFDLSPKDRTFVIDLIDKLRSYEAAPIQSAEATDGNMKEAPGLQSSAAAPGAPEGGNE